MIPEDDFSPVYLNGIGAKFVPTFRHKDGTPVDLTGATLSLKMVNISDQSIKNGSGSWTIDNAPLGQTHYTYGAGDLNEIGEFQLWAIATVGGIPNPADPKILVVDWMPS